MISAKKTRWSLLILLLFLLCAAGNSSAQNAADNDAPDVTARTARISYLSGDVQIKRRENQDWERAALNLPLVEGDEIAADRSARVEIQFDSANYLRLAENSYLKITTLRDEGIAVSLPTGTLSLRVLNFDQKAAYFEMDAPGTTVAVQRAGTYRIDAGDQNSAAVRVAVRDAGEAKIYSENAGFTLRDGRGAAVQSGGADAGDWRLFDAVRNADEFDEWIAERDAAIVEHLRHADFDKYYDRDFYGAEDLNDYGDWVYTSRYGYVWKPYANSTAGYADWSPYRYGQWRWVPPYGWTWINDEPWGYATYHHGRWVYDNRAWVWSPYGQYRSGRSWWRPALVVVSYIADNICWYPLPYTSNYYNYNIYNYTDRRRQRTTIINNTNVTINQPPPNQIPPDGVTTVLANQFGRNLTKYRSASVILAQQVLTENPAAAVRPRTLPTFRELNGSGSRDTQVSNPPINRRETAIRTGAIVRQSGVPNGETLRQERIFGNRPPSDRLSRQPNDQPNQTPIGIDSPTMRGTGAVQRQPRNVPANDNQTPIRPSSNRELTPNGSPIRATGSGRNDRNDAPPALETPRNVDRRRSAPTSPPPPSEQRDEQPNRPQPPARVRNTESATPQSPPPSPVRAAPRREERQPPASRVEPPPRREPVREQPPPQQETPPEKPASPSRKGAPRDG